MIAGRRGGGPRLEEGGREGNSETFKGRLTFKIRVSVDFDRMVATDLNDSCNDLKAALPAFFASL